MPLSNKCACGLIWRSSVRGILSGLGSVKWCAARAYVWCPSCRWRAPATELVADRVVHLISDDAPALIGCNAP